MNGKLHEIVGEVSPAQMIENGAVIFILILGLVMFFRGSSPFSRYFIPIVCITGVLLKVVTWAQNGNEPPFMTPLVSLVAGWIL
jgi:hypothetical protein